LGPKDGKSKGGRQPGRNCKVLIGCEKEGKKKKGKGGIVEHMGTLKEV